VKIRVAEINIEKTKSKLKLKNRESKCDESAKSKETGYVRTRAHKINDRKFCLFGDRIANIV